ncbi:hypothetical protein ACIO6T_19310 [Streptomyces sp. NPDC087532]|uniref:hypothetical protein n=1 Tax=Streptomyces sp. NPDC087532 TaxID=3365795 RepID=UPI003809CB2A
MAADRENAPVTFHNAQHHYPASASPLAPLPDHRNASTAWWQELWSRHAHITTPLRQRGLECNLEFGLSAYVVHVPLPDDSYLIISPPQEPPSSRPPGDPEGWSVTRQHPDDHALYEIVYDSVPADDPHAPARPEVRNGGSAPFLIEAIDRRLSQLGLLPAPPSPPELPPMSTAPPPRAPEPLNHASVARTAGAPLGPAAAADRTTTYIYGDALLALTDQLNDNTTYAEAAALLGQILEPTHGLLERLGELLEAAGEKAKEAEEDDGFDLSYDLADAAAEIRNLGETLNVAEDRMRELTAPPQPHRPPASPAHAPRLPLPGLPTPHRHTR